MRLLKVSSLPGMWLSSAGSDHWAQICRPVAGKTRRRDRTRVLGLHVSKYLDEGNHVSLPSPISDRRENEHVSFFLEKAKEG